MDEDERRWLFGEVVSPVAGDVSVLTGSANEPRCYRCDRIRRSDQLVVVDTCALIQWCIDEDECDEYQLQQKPSETGG